MKILLLQISDLHINAKNDIDVSKFCSFITSRYSTETQVIFCFTGDMTKSCQLGQFEQFKNLLNKISKIFDEYFDNKTQIVIVPGNHDIFLKKEDRNFTEIKKAVLAKDEASIKKYFDNDLKLCDYAISTCRDFGCFLESEFCDFKKIICDDLTINVVLLNSAPFSAIVHEDKDFHILRDDIDFSILEKNESKQITLLFAHHRPDWFEENSEKRFNSILHKYISIFIHGHDHDVNSSFFYMGKDEHLTLCGGEMDINAIDELVGDFNILEIDTDDYLNVKYKKVLYKKDVNSFVFENKGEPFCIPNKLKLRKLRPDFYNSFYRCDDVLDYLKIPDLFVMPYLNPEFSENSPISEFSELLSFLDKNRKIHIVGESGQSKTCLSKMIFKHYFDKKWVIYLNENNFNPNNFDLSIKNAFFEQYDADDDLFKLFKSDPLENKLLIFDCLDILNTKAKYLSFIEKQNSSFGYLVLTSLSKNNNDFKDGESIFGDYYIFNSLGISIKQRELLIAKICASKNITDNDTLQKILSTVEASLALSSSLDLTSPMMIILITIQIIEKKLFEERKTSDAFSIVFDFNLTNLLTKVGKESELSGYFLILSELAYIIFKKHDQIYFNTEIFSDAFKEAKKDHRFIDYDAFYALEIFIKSSIIIKSGYDKYKFLRNSFLSFFVAKKICSLMNDGIHNDVKYLIDNINESINSDIFLFVIYIKKNVSVIGLISEKLDSVLEGIPELNFEEKNNIVFKKETNFLPETPKQAENRQQLVQRLDKNEKARMVKNLKKEEKIFEKIEYGKLASSIITTSKIVEILSKTVAGFDEEIGDTERAKYLNIVLSSILKLLYLMFDFDKETSEYFENLFNDNKKRLLVEMKEKEASLDEIKRIEKLTYVDYLYRKIMNTALNYLTSISSICISKISLPLVDDISNDVFFKSIFKLCSYERFGKFDRFKNVLKYVYENKKDCDLQIVNRLVRMFVIKNGVKQERLRELSTISKINIGKLMRYNASFIEYNRSLKTKK